MANSFEHPRRLRCGRRFRAHGSHVMTGISLSSLSASGRCGPDRAEAVGAAVAAHPLDHAVAEAGEPGPLAAPEAGPPFVALFRPPGHPARVFPNRARHVSGLARGTYRSCGWHGVLLNRKTPREAGPPPRTVGLFRTRNHISPCEESTVRCPSPVGRPEGHSGCRCNACARLRPPAIYRGITKAGRELYQPGDTSVYQ